MRRRQRELDVQVEDLARRLAEVVNAAGPEHRQDLREYAIDLLRDATEAAGPAGDRPMARGTGSGTNPLGMALLLALVGVPMFFLFFPVGLVLLAVAFVMGAWGVAAVVFRR